MPPPPPCRSIVVQVTPSARARSTPGKDERGIRGCCVCTDAEGGGESAAFMKGPGGTYRISVCVVFQKKIDFLPVFANADTDYSARRLLQI